MRPPARIAPPLPAGQVSRRIHAPVAEVYAAVAELPQMGRFSPECVGGYWLDGADHAAVGVRFRGYNRFRWMRWSRIVEVTVADPPRLFEFRTLPGAILRDRTVWRYRFDAEGPATTRVTESFCVQRPPSWFIRALDVLAGRDWADPAPGMRTTLERLDQAVTESDGRHRPATA